jgi:thiopeptide-type bacteriocin biosynthesis protein
VQREFTLGSEWFYTKLYCGPKVANRLLVELVKPLTEALQAAGLIDRWFFIRYADPDNHLRIRLHLPDPGRIGELIRTVREYVDPFVTAGYVWKTQTDTYCRELERYGHYTIAQAEALFCADSVHAVALLEHSAADADADTAHWLWGMRLIDSLLDAFGYSLAQKAGLLRHTKDAFAQEFQMGKDLKLQVDQKYRQHRHAIHRVLCPDPAEALLAGEPLDLLAYHCQEVVQQASGQLRQLAEQGQLEVPLDQLLSSYIHMLLNRLISVQARLHEMVIYDFLHRHYLSEQARRKAQHQPPAPSPAGRGSLLSALS